MARFVLLLFLGCKLATSDDKKIIVVDWIEHNHFASNTQQQYIAWDWSDKDKCYRVVGWRLVDDKEPLTKSNGWHQFKHHRFTFRSRVYSESVREDPELADRWRFLNSDYRLEQW